MGEAAAGKRESRAEEDDCGKGEKTEQMGEKKRERFPAIEQEGSLRETIGRAQVPEPRTGDGELQGLRAFICAEGYGCVERLEHRAGPAKN